MLGHVATRLCPTLPTNGHRRTPGYRGIAALQTAQPRDLAALVLVIGLFAVLLVVTLMVGGPATGR